jgi:hypothetical protein
MCVRALWFVLPPLAALWIGCSGSNEPSVTNASSSASNGETSSAAAGSSAKAGAGGSSKTSSESGGAVASKSDAGAAAGNAMFTPLCSDVPPTAAGAPTKGGACTASDPQLCYKTCGPQSAGFKSETCTNGAYAEQSGCSFPDGDYACYKVPSSIDSSCPSAAPQATMPCEVAECVVCNAGGNYLDSSGASKAGYCVCPKAGASGSRKWSCASTTAWPCPNGKGC